jgi:hypothetical protein
MHTFRSAAPSFGTLRAAKLGEHEMLQGEWEMSKRVFGNGPSAEAPKEESGHEKH